MQGGQPIACDLSPTDLLRRWPADRPLALLHSGRPHPRWARYTFLAQPDGAVRFDGQSFQQTGRDDQPCDDPFAALQTAWDAEPDVLWLGYLGYDLGRWVEDLPSVASNARPWPILQFERCPGWLVYDNLEHAWRGHGTWANANPLADLPDHPRPVDFAAGPATPDQPRAAVEQSIQRVMDYIAAGDVFQVNLAHRFTGSFTGSTRTLYRNLIEHAPAWYGGYLELTTPAGDEARRSIASASPELFLQADASGQVTTRPIKGTLASSRPAEQLRDSAKDAAELAMIVDLLRNDLGRVCRFGTIRVQEPRVIETHPTIHHGVATITGELAAGMSPADLLRATMPGGSITGAPKVRAMQIIEELEPARRGPYCGAIGYVHGRDLRLNIAIRTLLLEQDHDQPQGRYHFSVGGGIVADSTPAAEYDETLAKAQAMLQGLGLGNRPTPQAQSQAQQ